MYNPLPKSADECTTQPPHALVSFPPLLLYFKDPIGDAIASCVGDNH